MENNQHNTDEANALVARLLANPQEFTGSDSNRLLDEFNRGFSIETLVNLLNSSDERVLEVGLFIADEFDKRIVPMPDEAVRLTHHENAQIRSWAYAACSQLKPSYRFIHVVRGIADPAPRCRKLAMVLMCRVPDATFEAVLQHSDDNGTDAELRHGLQMLLSQSAQDPAQVRASIQDDSSLVRRFGAVAACRIAEKFPDLLKWTADFEDSEVRHCAIAYIRLLAIMQKDATGSRLAS